MCKNFTVIAGPCVIEDIDTLKFVAERLKKLSEKYSFLPIFKASFKKANRSSINSYTGPGIEKGLSMLQTIKDEFGLNILSDVHETTDTDLCKDVCDILQIPAFLCRQTDLIISAAKTGNIVNIKKGQFVSPSEMKNALLKAYSTGNKKVILTERGTFFGYNNLVIDFRSFGEMKNLNVPVLYDATHSLQKPAISGDSSGGEPVKVRPLAKAAVATGWVDGLFIETHPTPLKAKSDAKSMVDLDEFEKIVKETMIIKGVL
ncbi:MAG: 3-deoxy-8-phosphooctulonate synthase [Candidatus Cloacimonadota bacterium]|nr:MAG: 3-deoxy-8-phosphooctulonate synthase [Candidatus Cloacimonadota bacterium]PIE79224.1 MAG: 3-deoxy-8-phosphooctulonate synthase [Candidatus Delongbacteria bacterium]